MFRRLKLFGVGGSTYVLLELAYRGRSHWSMFLLAGGCFLAMGHLRRFRLLPRMAAGSAVCTAGELAVGLLCNRDFSIWDYRRLPLNYRGQICLPFSLIWMALSVPGCALYGLLEDMQ